MGGITDFLNGITAQIQAMTGLSVLVWYAILNVAFSGAVGFGLLSNGKMSRYISFALLAFDVFILLNLYNQGY